MTGAPGESMSRGRRFRVLLVLGLLAGLGPFTIDLYLPAFPVLEDDFQTTAAAILGAGAWLDLVLGLMSLMLLLTIVNRVRRSLQEVQ